jgi:hypothetical protein
VINKFNKFNNKNSISGSDYERAYSQPLLTSPSPNPISPSSLYSPLGIPASQIPPGKEDLYILKSEVVPPVCPVCPPSIIYNSKQDNKKCPPCPPCARCPESPFECKKVPNYNAINSSWLPTPILNDYSTFGT